MSKRNNSLIAIAVSFIGLVGVAGAATSVESFDANPPRFGFEAGMILSNVTAPSDVTASNRAGLAAGVNFDVPLSPNFSILPEALFVQRGAELGRVGNLKWVAKLNSIEVPVFFKAKLPGTVSPFLLAGPVAIFNISNSVEAVGPSGGVSSGFNPRTFDFAVAAGGGAEIGPFVATIRYTLGITQLSETSANFKSQGVYLLAGLRI